MRVREIEVEGLDGLTTEERREENAILAEAGFVEGGGFVKGGYDDLLDELETGQRGGGAGAEAVPHTSEVDEMRAWEVGFLEACKQELNSRLIAAGMWCQKAAVSVVDGSSYVFVFRDGMGRVFDATLSVDDALDLRMALGEDWGRALIDKVTEAAHEARRRYFARMM